MAYPQVIPKAKPATTTTEAGLVNTIDTNRSVYAWKLSAVAFLGSYIQNGQHR